MKHWLLEPNQFIDRITENIIPALRVKLAFSDFSPSIITKTTYIGLGNNHVFVDGDFTSEEKELWQNKIPYKVIFVEDYRSYPKIKQAAIRNKAAQQNPIYWNTRKDRFELANPLTTILELSGFLPNIVTYQSPLFATPLASILMGGLMGAGAGHLLSKLIIGEPDTKAKSIARKLLVYGLSTGIALPGLLSAVFNVSQHGLKGLVKPNPLYTDILATRIPPRKPPPKQLREIQEEIEKDKFARSWQQYLSSTIPVPMEPQFPVKEASRKLKTALLSTHFHIKQAAQTVTTFLKGCVACYYLNNNTDNALKHLTNNHIKLASGLFTQAINPSHYTLGYYFGNVLCDWTKEGTQQDLPELAEYIYNIIIQPCKNPCET